MKAPSKIYIEDDAVINGFTTKVSISPINGFSEYIRKDALLERLERAKKMREKHGNAESIAPIDALIQIINSM